MHATELAKALAGQENLYAALADAIRAQDVTDDAGTVLAALRPALDAATGARLAAVDQGLVAAVIRHAQGLAPIPAAPAILAHIASLTPAPLFLPPIADSASIPLPTNGQDPTMPGFSDRAFDAWFAAKSVPYGLGLYAERRRVYATPQFADAASPERRTAHLGIDVFAPALTPVYAPLAGKVRHITYNADPLDYGHTLILEHDAGGIPFFTLYGHLAHTLPGLLAVGDSVQPGQHIAHLGDWHENGGWAAHIHFQIMTDMLGQTQGNFFGVGHDSLWPVWAAICPDPNLILRLPPERFSQAALGG
ncbi:peptidoglycan DD-metalloendopeptidase family protein [Fertoebacter nigrum]|uniref:Peptidoglycan DD-metalloendopeptidase family protein n=1 Tax=Fertoeibacter niger TaxID=2656921 RepID=A0A8X8KP16_9RHOB|nr:peptidoglycan DD-metalloendopeptidase family protein [Fertoeibacter niger]NUB44655.1 peptidoglycan DD-metalloendopeptidase family protein [Fertoeibacter niger]